MSYIHDGTNTTLFGYVGNAMIEEYRPSLPYRRYVPGPGVDETLVWYEGSDRRWLHADERGSTVAISDASGTVTNVLSYAEYGTPAATNSGRFQYTGQAWLPELNLGYYKARMYNPRIGRFMQTDPIGYAGGINLYGYVSGDPINLIDPSGLVRVSIPQITCKDVSVTVSDANGNFGPATSSQTCYINVIEYELPNFRGGGGGGGVGGGGAGVQTPPPPGSNQCPPNQRLNRNARIAEAADEIGLAADGVTVAAGLFGLASAPTGAGPAGAAVVAFAGAVVSRGAAVVGLGANVANRNIPGIVGNLVGIVGGTSAGIATRSFASRYFTNGRAFGGLSAGGSRASRVAGDAAAATYGVGAQALGCP